MTDLDQARVDKGVGYVHGEIDKLLAQGPDQPRRGQPAQGAGDRVDRQGGVRRRRLRDRGGLRGARRQAAGLRRGRGGRLRRLRARHQHLLAVGHRDGRRAAAPGAGRRLPLLQPGRGACRCSRSCGPSAPTTRRWPRRSRSARRCRKSCVLVKDAPAFVVNRLLTRFLGEVTRPSTRARRSRSPTARCAPLGLPMPPFVLLAARRSGRRPARGRDAARGLPGPVLASRRTCSGSSRPGAPGSTRWDERGRPYVDDDTEALLDEGDLPLDRRAGARARAGGAGRGVAPDARRGRRGRARRTSTCA